MRGMEYMLKYNRDNIPRAKSLRQHMTPWERALWYRFLRQYPVRWYRQKAIGNFITDFYCARAKLVVELDGGGHYTSDQAVKDHERTRVLENMGLSVLRFCNADIDRRFDDVCRCIDMTVKERINM